MTALSADEFLEAPSSNAGMVEGASNKTVAPDFGVAAVLEWKRTANATQRSFSSIAREQSSLADTALLCHLNRLFGFNERVDPEDVAASNCRFDLLPLDVARARSALIFLVDGKLCAAITDPLDHELKDQLVARAYPEALAFSLLIPEQLIAIIERAEASHRALDTIADAEHTVDAIAGTLLQESVSLDLLSAERNHVVRLLSSTLLDALQSGASDIHCESTGGGMRLKFRIDGVLVEAGRAHGTAIAEQLISRIKVLANLNIAERRIPQDGRLGVAWKGRRTDLRVSIMPSIHGEDAVLRILDKSGLLAPGDNLSLSALGLFVLSFAGIGISFYPYIVPGALTIKEATAPDASRGCPTACSWSPDRPAAARPPLSMPCSPN